MKRYAVISIKGRQYKVSEGEEILVDKVSDEKTVSDVLLFVGEDKIRIGKPFVKDAKISLKIIEREVKGEKVMVSKYKAKSRYRRKMGFRPRFTKLLVEKIS